MGAGGRPGLSLWSLAAVSRVHLVAAILGVRLQNVGDAADSLLVSIMPSMQTTARLVVDQSAVQRSHMHPKATFSTKVYAVKPRRRGARGNATDIRDLMRIPPQSPNLRPCIVEATL